MEVKLNIVSMALCAPDFLISQTALLLLMGRVDGYCRTKQNVYQKCSQRKMLNQAKMESSIKSEGLGKPPNRE